MGQKGWVEDMAVVRSNMKKSNIRFIYLQDQIALHPGLFTSNSILSPMITVERTKEDVLISARFLLQADIKGFDVE